MLSEACRTHQKAWHLVWQGDQQGGESALQARRKTSDASAQAVTSLHQSRLAQQSSVAAQTGAVTYELSRPPAARLLSAAALGLPRLSAQEHLPSSSEFDSSAMDSSDVRARAALRAAVRAVHRKDSKVQTEPAANGAAQVNAAHTSLILFLVT